MNYLSTTSEVLGFWWDRIRGENPSMKRREEIDPISVIALTALMLFKEEGSQILLTDHRVCVQQPSDYELVYNWQWLSRTLYCVSREDLEVIKTSILKVSLWYDLGNPENKAVRNLLKSARVGLECLKKHYESKSGLTASAIEEWKGLIDKLLTETKSSGMGMDVLSTSPLASSSQQQGPVLQSEPQLPSSAASSEKDAVEKPQASSSFSPVEHGYSGILEPAEEVKIPAREPVPSSSQEYVHPLPLYPVIEVDKETMPSMKAAKKPHPSAELEIKQDIVAKVRSLWSIKEIKDLNRLLEQMKETQGEIPLKTKVLCLDQIARYEFILNQKAEKLKSIYQSEHI